MVIICEGCDNTGKTTLVQRLQLFTGARVVHSPGPQPEKELKSWTKAELLLANVEDIIYDRFPLISEEVYGPILRGKSLFGEEWGEWWGALMLVRPVIIYCRPPREVVCGPTLMERDQMEGVVSHCNQLLDAYDKLMKKIQSLIPHDSFFVYDYTQDPMALDLRGRLEEGRWSRAWALLGGRKERF